MTPRRLNITLEGDLGYPLTLREVVELVSDKCEDIETADPIAALQLSFSPGDSILVHIGWTPTTKEQPQP